MRREDDELEYTLTVTDLLELTSEPSPSVTLGIEEG